MAQPLEVTNAQVGRERVCAIVVTYNRKEILRGCLDALLEQTYPIDRILVIDNASTDGTDRLFLEAKYGPQSRIAHVQLSENGGGAAGFHEGFKQALALPCEWIWAMDDDGLPEREALAHLLAAPETAGGFRGPLVLAREEMSNSKEAVLAFTDVAQTDAGPRLLRTRGEAEAQASDGVIRGYASVFNGVLVRRDVAEKIGLPNKAFFIWGDEWDYLFRARKHGIEPVTIARALYWHPKDRTKRAKIRVAWLEYDVPCATDKFRSYLLIRNHAYLASRYRGFVAWLRHTLKYMVYHGTTNRCFSRWQVLRYSVEGLRGRFQGRSSFGES